MNRTIQNLLKNKYVLYSVLFLALTNVLGYLAIGDFESLVFFIMLGLLSSYFSKNMIINLSVSILGTNILFSRKKLYEGMENSTSEEKKETKKTKEEKEHNENKESQETTKEKFSQQNIPKSQPANISDEDDGIGERIDYAKTLEQAYDNLQNMLGTQGMSGLTKETQKLVDQQKSLMSTMKDMGPMVKMFKESMGSINNKELQGTLGNLTNVMKGLQNN